MDLLKSLILASEKAANVARICRQNEHLFQLLVQQKKPDEANPRFVDDFKTLADVLIQEMIKHDIGNQFPELVNHIHGEENNTFSNKLGETIRVEVKPHEEETSDLLGKVLNGDRRAADLLAAEVHRTIQLENVNTETPTEEFSLDLQELGIWIDPIDCTAEYINGNANDVDEGICKSGLECVTVLIGAYDKKTELPLIGIVNQPFLHQADPGEWRGRCIWGVSTTTTKQHSLINNTSAPNNVISLSSSENQSVKAKLNGNGFKLVEASGAGYKILTVISGLADGYVLSKSSTFKWDTCAPHAILRSLGGGVLNYEEAVGNGKFVDVKYPWAVGEASRNCNRGGVLAYRRKDVLEKIVSVLI